MSAHTKGKLKWNESGMRLESAQGKCVADLFESTTTDEELWANGSRLRDCWNALEGIADPAAFVARAKELGA